MHNNDKLIHKTHNDKYVRIDGTHLLDEIKCSYQMIKDAFGLPNCGDEYKIDAEWDIEFDDGLIATIYNWKDGKNYQGKNGTPKTRIEHWHIGGKDPIVVNRIWSILTKDNHYEASL
ncbi:hypothetical protein UFOVP118_10 [uncultured Caudovirales phage]|uniref:Uncharacterized protein n=1 Tax=uncultured Caudovirales phage TaxID=2100421 RepID=A0A6J5L9B4_9CAUD|nr:hypothetical protein UFOVP118_10 [uncultured Caudovirales phage]